MNNNINIAGILRDMPEGTPLYSPVCGDLKLDEVTPNGIFCLQPDGMDNGKRMAFMEDGHLKNYGDFADHGECLLFPSASMRDWDKFFKRGDVVYNEYIRTYAIFEEWVDDSLKLFRTAYSYRDTEEGHYDIGCEYTTEDFVRVAKTSMINILIKRLEVHYHGKFNTNTLSVEPTHHFKPFDRVLAREDDEYTWCADIFSHFKVDTSEYVCIGGAYDECIPYNEKTAHLVGTKDPYEE